jgi:hypothetical protein
MVEFDDDRDFYESLSFGKPSSRFLDIRLGDAPVDSGNSNENQNSGILAMIGD